MASLAADLNHPERRALNDEVHARPPDNLPTPCALAYLARLPAGRKQDRHASSSRLLNSLLEYYDVAPPPAEAKHYMATLDDVSLRWERHTEYSRYSFFDSKASETPFSASIAGALPADWIASMRGELLVGVSAAIASSDVWHDDVDEVSERYFDGNVLVGARVADGYGIALTDFRIREDGLTRLLLIDLGMTEAQSGRVMQRLLEIETYRMMCLLALPVAQKLMPVLDNDERELASIGEALVSAGSQHEPELLDRITRLAAASQHRHLRSDYRFAAADAYYDIVLQRISELRETRIPALQTFEEFTTRRLAPAVKTYRAVSKRQRTILEQMARATKLLSTRIDIERQRQNQSLLASMNRRVKAQLRLQATVEGLSVAAVTYYLVGLVGTLAKSVTAFGIELDKDIVAGVSIPIIASAAYLGIRRLRKEIHEEGADP
jgi:uncharacterized membrane-anchored protein